MINRVTYPFSSPPPPSPSHPLLLLITLSSLLYLSSQDDCGDYVVVTNARSIVVTGKKSDQKLYRHHSGFPGGLKEIPYKTLMEKKPEEIIRRAVSGMLPKNRLRAKRMERLFIYPDHVHPYEENFMKDHAQEFRVAFGAVGKEGREEKI